MKRKADKKRLAAARRKFSKRADAIAKARNEVREELATKQVLIMARITEIYFGRGGGPLMGEGLAPVPGTEAQADSAAKNGDEVQKALFLGDSNGHSYIYNAMMRGDSQMVKAYFDDNGIEMLYENSVVGLQSRKLTWVQCGKAVVSLIQGETISYRDGQPQREFRFCVRDEATGEEYPIIFDSTEL